MAVVECPSCGQELNVPDDLAGKKVRCTKCAGTFTAAATRSIPDRSDFDDEDDDLDEREQRRSRPRGKPHRGGMIMAFGIISVALALVSIGALLGAGPFAVPVNVIGLVLGILAWIWG